MSIELLIASASGKIYQPIVEDGIEWSTERRGSPGKLTFKVIQDGELEFEEGAAVRLQVNGKGVFYGFVFTKKTDKERIISVTAYDQLRYLNNKDTLVFNNMTASQILRQIATDHRLNLGTIENTGYVMASRVEDNTSLSDMLWNALDDTLQNTGQMFVPYDDFGRLCLRNIASLRIGENGAFLMIDEETGQNYDYQSSIDSDTYNKVKLTYDNEDTGTREVYIAQDGTNINRWGVLQYFDTLKEGENGQAKADALLSLYNKKTRSLKITKAIGDIRVRAGCMVVVSLSLVDTKVQNFMLVEKCKHMFNENEHWMDLTLRGGEFIA